MMKTPARLTLPSSTIGRSHGHVPPMERLSPRMCHGRCHDRRYHCLCSLRFQSAICTASREYSHMFSSSIWLRVFCDANSVVQNSQKSSHCYNADKHRLWQLHCGPLMAFPWHMHLRKCPRTIAILVCSSFSNFVAPQDIRYSFSRSSWYQLGVCQCDG